MVSLLKGMAVQPSRFAVLSLGKDSDSEDESSSWQVAQPKLKGMTKKAVVSSSQHEEGKVLSKNAKKRARKKRNKSTSSDNAVPDTPNETEKDGGIDDMYGNVWKQRNEEAMEVDYQKDLREALLLSAMDPREVRTSKVESVPEAKRIDQKPSKRNIKLTLQELHKLPTPSVQDTDVRVTTPSQGASSKQVEDQSLWLGPEDGDFLLEDIESEITKAIERDKVVQTKGKSSLSEEDQSMIPRLAQLEDKLEKRDKIILKVKKENVALKNALKEVKKRNQSLCTIMSQGEFSEKADLVKQVNDLSVLKDDLTLEIESLNTALEQEKSKNKLLKADLTKFQNLQSKGATKHSVH